MTTVLRLLLLILVFTQTLAATSTAPQTAEAVIEKHLAALGGRDALVKLVTRKSSGTITITTANGDLSGPIEIAAKAPNKSSTHSVLDLSKMGMSEKMVLDQRFDGTRGWVLNSLQGDTEMPASQLANQRNNVFPTPFLTYKETGTTIRLLPSEKIGVTNAVVLEVAPQTGPVSKVFLDPQTYLVMRTTLTVEHPGVGKFDQLIEPSDYRAVDGVQTPFLIVTTSQVQTVTIKLTKVEHNVAIDDAVFSVITKLS